MAKQEEALRLGKSGFDKSRFKRLSQENHTWEADFRMLPKPPSEKYTHYHGMVVRKRGGEVLAQSHVEGRPSVNDLASLLAEALQHPLAGKAARPRRLHLRKHPQWRELFSHLEEIEISVTTHQELPAIVKAYDEYLRQQREILRTDMPRPSSDQVAIEKLFPSIARWVQGYGHIEIGDQEMQGFVVRALDYGGLAFEDDRPNTLAEAMNVLEQGLVEYFEQEDRISRDFGKR